MTIGGPPAGELLTPDQLTSRLEALSRPSSVPTEPGIYVWYFNVPPLGVPTEGTHRTEFGHLHYVGIAPREPRRADCRRSSPDFASRSHLKLLVHEQMSLVGTTPCKCVASGRRHARR